MADSQDDKLYKAEYAKSGRASCKKCKENIAKDSLRMAIMVQSPMFDGKVPHWHHFSCFWLRAAVQSPSDISGFTDLRWDDQEKVKKAIESGGATGGKGEQKGAAKGEKTLNDFAVEYAKSNRSTCKGCDQKIEKDHIRVSKKTVDPEKPQLGLIDRWYHTACFVSRREELLFKPEYSAAQLKGFAALRDEDKEELKKRLPAVKNEGKRKIDDVDGGVSKKQKKEDEKLELKLKEQSQLIWRIKDKLKKFCSINDMKELLIANNQEVPSGESNIIDRLSDCMAFGSLKPCETCKGQLVFKSDAYYCTGDISAWTKCVFKTQTPDRKDWVTPKEFSEIPFLKKFKFKRQDRVFPKDAPPAAPTPSSAAATVTSAAPSASTAASNNLTEVPADKPLTGLKLLAVGKLRKNKDELKNAVEELGGKITGTANKAALCLSSKKEIEKMSKKMEEVRDAGVRVVAEDFLTAIKESGKALQELISLHAISPWGAEVKVESQAAAPASKSTGAHSSKSTSRVKEEEAGGSKSKKMKLTVKGGAAVDPDSGLENCAHVLDQNGKIYSATLGLVDIVRGTNSYYKLQLLEDDVKKQYWVFRSWGRVGTTIGGNKLDKFYDKNSAMDNFCSVYEEKTGNAWASSNFTKYPNKFYPLEIDYGQDEEAVKKLTASTGAKSKLDKPIQDLIRMIFDVESMKKAMVEFEIDLQKMPLGKLSKRQIQSAYSLLSEVQQVVADSAAEAQILDLSNRFYTLIPHDFGMKKPPLLNNTDYIQQKVQMLDNLLDIEVAYSLLRGGVEDNKKDPIDINYEKLKTKIEVVEQSSSEAQLILQYLKNTHAATHNTYTLDVEEIFKIDREGESQRFRPFKELQNRQLLWHGSRTTNYAGILSQGLRIAPPEAPVTGYMFGKGVYFADMVSKSANYCHTSQADPVGLLLLGEVALGNIHELKKASHITKLPKGKHSVKGLGRTAPDPRATVSLNGVDVPLGKGINTNTEDTSLLYNEYIVYDIAQVNLKYLLKIRFNYQTSLW
ncbi:poly [ADP-ribose] polymerase 1-like isoform X1 [Sinocyclocheilus anshuiensis]|uniref:poly [ADP-ribose] polymerase 1-like isoform X1 n=1 Tax=Sinocyclocheilus anshuiensis TaxID=1608454 RepID=UPI0007BA705E|nr:PREDICTED: poly [ADP-ribose] polymerase 1-like isoform X1 [Sinocyclocheilus anshuiensis]